MCLLNTVKTANFLTYNLFLRRLVLWHMNEGVVVEKFLDDISDKSLPR